MLSLTIFSILAAIAAMAYVFSGLRRFEDSSKRLEERAKARPSEPLPPPAPRHPLGRKGAAPPTNKEHP